jgi:hypothetical protein
MDEETDGSGSEIKLLWHQDDDVLCSARIAVVASQSVSVSISSRWA